MKKKSIVLSAISVENLKTLKCYIFTMKHHFFLLFVITVAVIKKKYLKKKN